MVMLLVGGFSWCMMQTCVCVCVCGWVCACACACARARACVRAFVFCFGYPFLDFKERRKENTMLGIPLKKTPPTQVLMIHGPPN